jgi:hypothetical protein
MVVKVFGLAACAALLACGAASAQGSADAAGPLPVPTARQAIGPAAANTLPAKPAVDPDKIRCRSYTETGSLAHVVRECHTNADWHLIAERHRQNLDGYRDPVNAARNPN